MTKRSSTEDLYDPRSGGKVIRIESVRFDGSPFEPARTNYFSVYLIESGTGTFSADASQFAFGSNALLFFVPYQYIRFHSNSPVNGLVVQFHANFLCVETFHAEAGCSGILFNDTFGSPVVALDQPTKAEVANLIERIRKEQVECGLAFGDVMLAYLKVLLILAARLKSPKPGVCELTAVDPRHPALSELRDLIEKNYRSLHSPADYAKRLHLTPKTLGRIVREHLGTTPTDLIRNRILTHAKWHLLHTLKPVKEISLELGFGDELYFSRLFKKATGHSPTFFREFETEIRGGSNLSMFTAQAPIPHSAGSADT